MKQPRHKGREMLPLSVSDAARSGDAEGRGACLAVLFRLHKQALYPDAL